MSARRRPRVWLALLAILWQALLPWSNALAHPPGAGERVPVCTATGLKWIALDDEAPAKPGASSELTHCALCYFEDDAPALHDSRELPVVLSFSATSAPAPVVAPSPAGIDAGIPPPIRAPPLRS